MLLPRLLQTTLLLVLPILSACDKQPPPHAPPPPPAEHIAIDGSSTVYPITQEVVRRYGDLSQSKIDVAVSGTGGGFQKFCRGETIVNDASRPIEPGEETLCAANGVTFVEFPIAFDGIAVVVHKDNDWTDSITVEELRRLWRPEAQSQITRWNQIRPSWPNVPIHLYGPGEDSGTYDYFMLAILGEQRGSRRDYTASEDDEALVKGISSDGLSLGFFGFAYYRSNALQLKALAIDPSNPGTRVAPVLPSIETIRNGTYQPLSRPLFLYVNAAALARPAVLDFVEFYIDVASLAVDDVGYVKLPKRAYDLARARARKRQVGSTFAGVGSELGLTIDDLMDAETAVVRASP